MRKYTKSLPFFLLLICISCLKKNHEIIFPKGLNPVSLNDSIPFNPEWYNYEYKVVNYLKGGFPLSLNWADFIEEFPEIAFIFYVAEKDSSVLRNKLKEYNYFGPVIHDPENQFFELNQIDKMDLPQDNFILFTVKDNIIIDRARKKNNPSFPEHFKKYLEKFLDEN